MTFDPTKLKYEFNEFIGVFHNAFVKEECEDIIEMFEAYHKVGFTYSRQQDGRNVEKTKIDDTALDCNNLLEYDSYPSFMESFSDRYYKYLYPLYADKYATLQNLRKHIVKRLKVQKTLPSQGFHIWHSEYDGNESIDRVLALMIYLNDVEEGGETEFLYQSLRFKPTQGTFLIWPAQFTHTHRGNPPLTHAKYIVSGWTEFVYVDSMMNSLPVPSLDDSPSPKDVKRKKRIGIEYE